MVRISPYTSKILLYYLQKKLVNNISELSDGEGFPTIKSEDYK